MNRLRILELPLNRIKHYFKRISGMSMKEIAGATALAMFFGSLVSGFFGWILGGGAVSRIITAFIAVSFYVAAQVKFFDLFEENRKSKKKLKISKLQILKEYGLVYI